MKAGISDSDLEFLGRIENGVSLSKLSRDKWEAATGCTLEEEIAKLVAAGLARHAPPEESLMKHLSEHELRELFEPGGIPGKCEKAKLAKLAVEYADAVALQTLMDMCPVYEATGEGRIDADEYRDVSAARVIAERRRANLARLRGMLPGLRENKDVFPFALWSCDGAEPPCVECRSRNGKIYRIEDIVDFPPRYCDCLDCCPCILIAMTESMAAEEVGNRRARWARKP